MTDAGIVTTETGLDEGVSAVTTGTRPEGDVSAVTTETGPDEDVSTRWRRPLEALVFAFPVAVGAGLVAAALYPTDHLGGGSVGSAVIERPVVLLVALVLAVGGGLVWTVALAAAVYLDAESVGEAVTDWEPSGATYAALVLVIPLAALHYLLVRHRHVRPTAGSGRWWYLIPAATLLLFLPFLAVRGGVVPPATVLVGAGLAMVVFPIAAYEDAVHLRGVGADWQPDPPVHLLVAVFATLFWFVQPVYAGYYLLRRRRATGRR